MKNKELVLLTAALMIFAVLLLGSIADTVMFGLSVFLIFDAVNRVKKSSPEETTEATVCGASDYEQRKIAVLSQH